MSAICTCKRPDVKQTDGGEKFCKTCGCWWDLRYGSIDPFAMGFEIVYKNDGPKFNLPKHPHRGCNARRADPPKIGRNKICRCGSAKKYKHCCLRSDEQSQHNNTSLQQIVDLHRKACGS